MAAVMVLMCLFMVLGPSHRLIDPHAGAAPADAQQVQVRPSAKADE
ncbi:MAG TPA: hypothetical protein VIV54_15060 [Burkholderiales bacterium]